MQEQTMEEEPGPRFHRDWHDFFSVVVAVGNHVIVPGPEVRQQAPPVATGNDCHAPVLLGGLVKRQPACPECPWGHWTVWRFLMHASGRSKPWRLHQDVGPK